MKKVMLVMLLTFALVFQCGCSNTMAPNASSENSTSFSASEPNQNYPEKTITCIVPFAAGGGNDTLTRALSGSIDLPVTIVVQNMDGAGGLIGAQEAYRASNDGYTILSHNPPNLVSQTLSGASDVELWKELELICFLADDDYVARYAREQYIFPDDGEEVIKLPETKK